MAYRTGSWKETPEKSAKYRLGTLRRDAKKKGHAMPDTNYRQFPVWLAGQIEASGGVCPVCARPFGDKGPCVDHDHVTGKLRGLLCCGCNVAEGFYKRGLAVKNYYKSQNQFIDGDGI